MKVIGNIISIVLFPIFIYLIYVLFVVLFFSFELLLSFSTDLGLILHILIWVFLIFPAFGLFTFAPPTLLVAASEKLTNSYVIFKVILLLIGGIALLTPFLMWFGFIEFSWQHHFSFSFINQLFFSLILLTLAFYSFLSFMGLKNNGSITE